MLKKRLQISVKYAFYCKKGENKNEHLDWFLFFDQEALDRFIRKNSIVSVCLWE